MFNDVQGTQVVEDENVFTIPQGAKIKVMGVGGAGNNAVKHMIEAGITSAEYICVNTDYQILEKSPCNTKIQIGAKLTKGLGAGSDPEIGRQAAEESKDLLTKAIEGTDLLFITAGMGGGTGTGAAPTIAKLAKDMKILTVAVVTEPFAFEGKKRMDNAIKGIEALRKCVDSIVIIPNDKILLVAPKNTPIKDAMHYADEVLRQGISGIADLIVQPSFINLDYADVKTVLKESGRAHMGVGVAKGENRIMDAVRLAVDCPLLDTTIEGATGVIINIVGGNDLTIEEIQTAGTLVQGAVDYTANIIFGARIDENMADEVAVTIIATGFRNNNGAEALQMDEERKRAQGGMFVSRQARPVAPVQPIAPVEPVYEQSVMQAQPVVQESAPVPVASQPVYEQPVAPQPAPVEAPVERAPASNSKLPPFVQRLFRRKEDN